MEGNLEQQGSLTCSWHSSPHYLCEAPFRVLPELRVLNWMQIQRKNLGGGAGGIRRFGAASREATLPYKRSLVHRICKKLMYLGWGKRGGSDGVNKCGRESSPRGLHPLARELPWTFLPSRPSCCPAAYHHSLGTDAPRSAPAWTGYRAQLESF